MLKSACGVLRVSIPVLSKLSLLLFTIMGRVGVIVFGAAFCLISVITINTLSYSRNEKESPCSPNDTDYIAVDSAMLERFKAGLRFETVSRGVQDFNPEEATALVEYIIKSRHFDDNIFSSTNYFHMRQGTAPPSCEKMWTPHHPVQTHRAVVPIDTHLLQIFLFLL